MNESSLVLIGENESRALLSVCDLMSLGLADKIVAWIATNGRSYAYMLPDSLKLALNLGLVAYFTMHFQQA